MPDFISFVRRVVYLFIFFERVKCIRAPSLAFAKHRVFSSDFEFECLSFVGFYVKNIRSRFNNIFYFLVKLCNVKHVRKKKVKCL